jgi:hypothetical protein
MISSEAVWHTVVMLLFCNHQLQFMCSVWSPKKCSPQTGGLQLLIQHNCIYPPCHPCSRRIAAQNYVPVFHPCSRHVAAQNYVPVLIKSPRAISFADGQKKPTFQEPPLSLSSGIWCDWIPQTSLCTVYILVTSGPWCWGQSWFLKHCFL